MSRHFLDTIHYTPHVGCSVSLLVVMLVALSIPTIARAQGACPSSSFLADSFAAPRCEVRPLSQWSDPERWVWSRICAAKPADLNRKPGNEWLDPRDPKDNNRFSNGHRTLRSSFLSTILSEQKFRNAITEEGIRICGAYFSETVHLNGASIPGGLQLSESFFLGRVYLNGLRTAKGVSLSGSNFEMHLHLTGASIPYVLNLSNASFLFIDLSELNRSQEEPASISLRNSTVTGHIEMMHARAANLDIRGATLKYLDLTGTEIRGSLSIGGDWKAYETVSGEPHDPVLKLGDVRVGNLSASPDDWADNIALELHGLEFDKSRMISEHSDDFWDGISLLGWLEKDKTYSSQPYEHLGKLLRAEGKNNMADIVLHANRMRASGANVLYYWFALLYRNIAFRILFGLLLVGVFTTLGAVVLHFGKRQDDSIEKVGWFYSLDMLTPGLKLRDEHYAVVLNARWVRNYFLAHKAVGYVLVSIIITMLSGIVEL